jgi:L-fuconolactonase
MKIDAHQHYWRIARGDYFWMGPHVQPIFRDFMPEDLAGELATAGVAKTVVVQAADTVAETEFLLELAAGNDSIAAVVGWVDMMSDDAVATLKRLTGSGKLKSIRPMLQDIEDTFYILRPQAIETLAALPGLGLVFDALLQPRHLPVIAALADRLPDLSIVVNHCAKPFIANGVMEPWKSDIAALALRPNVYLKLSGLLTEAAPGAGLETIAPYAMHALSCFGPERTMFGSDWPVLTLASGFQDWFHMAEALTEHLTPEEKDAVFGGTAARFYGIG